MLISRVVRDKHFLHAVELCCSLGYAAAPCAGDQDMHRCAQRLCGGQRLAGCIVQGMIVMLGQQQRCHDSTPASFLSLPTRSSTEVTLRPAWRLGGSTILMTLRRGSILMPSSSTVISLRGFFFAFIMFGKLASRGSLRRKSAVKTAGSFRIIV